jgi:hypothetical protein
LPLISLSMIATMKINHNSLKPFIFQWYWDYSL